MPVRHNYYQDLSREQADQRFAELDRQYWDAQDYLAAIATERAALLNVMQANNWPKPEETV